MAKTIYTERDIDDLARRGVNEIAVTDQVYVTDVARERAEKLGVALRIVSETTAPAASRETVASGAAASYDVEQAIARVKSDVLAKLGPSVDPALIDRIVRRIISQLK
jgi:hypothetical protein